MRTWAIVALLMFLLVFFAPIALGFLASEYQNLSKYLSDAQEEITICQGQSEQQNQALGDALARVDQKNIEIQRQEHERNELEQMLAAERSENGAMRARNQALEQEMDAYRQESESQRIIAEIAVAFAQRLQGKVLRMEAKVSELEQENRALSERLRNFENAEGLYDAIKSAIEWMANGWPFVGVLIIGGVTSLSIFRRKVWSVKVSK